MANEEVWERQSPDWRLLTGASACQPERSSGGHNWSSGQFATFYDRLMGNRIVTATELKAKRLALLDEVEEGRGTITVTKRGQPVATLKPVSKKPWKSPKGPWAGKVRITGDIVGFDASHLWDAVRKG
jgi:prevent-host-death family protein